MNIVEFYNNGELGSLTFQIRGPPELMKPIAAKYKAQEQQAGIIYELECICSRSRSRSLEPQADCPRLKAILDLKNAPGFTECECMSCRDRTFSCWGDLTCPNVPLTMLSPQLGKESVLQDAHYSASIDIGDTYLNGHAENNHHFIEEFLALSSQQSELEIVLHFAESCCTGGEHCVAQIQNGQVVYRKDTPNNLEEDISDYEQVRVCLAEQGAKAYKDFLSRVVDPGWFIAEVCSGSMEDSPEFRIKYDCPVSIDDSHV